MLERLPRISPPAYARLTLVALGALALIVLTGAAVRVTGSGLGCPDWPKCYGGVVAPLEVHAVIEYANRLFTGLVGLAAVAAFAGAILRRPRRRDLLALGALLPLGVAAQAVLGGLTVRHELAPGYVMAHFSLSMVILVGAVALAWRARFEPGDRPRSADRLLVWSVRSLAGLGALTLFAGTVVTAAGPHAGAQGKVPVHRLRFEGAGTLKWAVHRHATVAAIFGAAALAVWLLVRLRGGDAQLRRASTVLLALLAAQGVIGGVQYALKLPAEIVWVHVAVACLTWLSTLWTTAAAGRLVPREAAQRAEPVPLQAAR